ncbi:MAG: STAS domain-containing protein [Acidobacteriaceae bacterium]|jgi:anti-anti-sigma factor
MTQAQIWKNSPFSIERKEGKAPGTVIFRLCGPFTARDMYGSLAPIDLQNMLDFQSAPSAEPPVLNILDLTAVPYMDSTGLGMIVKHYVHYPGNGVRVIAAGANSRVLELFRLTKMDGVITTSSSIDDADIR